MMLPSRTRSTSPTYPLPRVKQLIEARRYVVTMAAAQSARAHGINEQAIISTVFNLNAGAFQHSMPAEDKKARAAGLWQDVYRVTIDGLPFYVKLQVTNEAWLIIVSFKLG